MTGADVDGLRRLRSLVASAGDSPSALAALARAAHATGERSLAVDLAERALALTRDAAVRATARSVLSASVPDWHFTIVGDAARNAAYEAAIGRAVRPGCLVLEIGAGTGLLAMMAARAGARVVTCEADPAVASAARDVVAANGLSDRIQVVSKPSGELDLDADLGGRADILLSEIVSNNVVGQGVIASHAGAAHLLRPGARVIPAAATVRVALASFRPPVDRRMGEVAGFDLSAFNRLERPYREISTGSPHLQVLSRPADLLTLDLARAAEFRPFGREVTLTALEPGANAFVQWMRLDLDGEGAYENAPGGGPSCWSPMVWRFDGDDAVEAGACVRAAGRCEEASLRIWREP